MPDSCDIPEMINNSNQKHALRMHEVVTRSRVSWVIDYFWPVAQRIVRAEDCPMPDGEEGESAERLQPGLSPAYFC